MYVHRIYAGYIGLTNLYFVIITDIKSKSQNEFSCSPGLTALNTFKVFN
jgi:hypothetical protein